LGKPCCWEQTLGDSGPGPKPRHTHAQEPLEPPVVNIISLISCDRHSLVCVCVCVCVSVCVLLPTRASTHQDCKKLVQVAHTAVCPGAQEAAVVNVKVKHVREFVAVVHLQRVLARWGHRCRKVRQQPVLQGMGLANTPVPALPCFPPLASMQSSPCKHGAPRSRHAAVYSAYGVKCHRCRAPKACLSHVCIRTTYGIGAGTTHWTRLQVLGGNEATGPNGACPRARVRGVRQSHPAQVDAGEQQALQVNQLWGTGPVASIPTLVLTSRWKSYSKRLRWSCSTGGKLSNSKPFLASCMRQVQGPHTRSMRCACMKCWNLIESK